MFNCLYCGSSTNLKPLKHWDKDQYDYFCSEHIEEVRNFQNKQKRGFFEHFKDPKLREKYLSKQQQELYNQISKEYKNE